MPNSPSMLGRYVPPGPDIADGYDRESRYVIVNDGCRIAVDILHPAAAGKRLEGPRPTVLHATPYRRAWLRAENSRTAARYEQALAGIEPGQLVTQYETRPLATTLIHQGYNFVSLDLRGTGASSGASYIDSWRAGLDIAQVIDWIVDQPWATDRVGMVGISYEGMAQFFTAAFAPAGLACIVPQYPGLPQCYVDGGLAISGFARTWEALHKGISEDEPSAPVDGPDGPPLRADAEAERDPSRYDWVETFARMDPRDVTRMAAHDGILRERDRSDLGLPPVASGWIGAHDLLNAAGVPTYIVTGWWDLTFPGFLIDAFNRLTVPKKLIVGPWNHGQAGDPEALRWLDHWLKDIDNGVTDEPPVHYATSEPSGAQTWSSAPRLPLPEAQPRSLYLSAAPSATINSVHDGTLAASPIASAESVDYAVDHDVSLGLLTRHTFYTDDLYITTPDLVARGERCLTFTGAPLPDDIEIVGTPALELQLATTSDRGAIVATLEQVSADGGVAYLSEGFLNFEHRRPADPPLGHAGPVWHSWSKADLLPVTPGAPMNLSFELYPIGCKIRAGDRLRLTLAAADANNLIVPTIGDDATLTLTLGGEHPARLQLPIVNSNLAPTAQPVNHAFTNTPNSHAFRRPQDPLSRTSPASRDHAGQNHPSSVGRSPLNHATRPVLTLGPERSGAKPRQCADRHVRP